MDEEKCGELLLAAFRSHQASRGHSGCDCLLCKADMTKALQSLLREGVLVMKKTKPAKRRRA